MTVRLGLTFGRMNHYRLHIELKMPDPVPGLPAPVAEIRDALDGRCRLRCLVCAAGRVENVDTGVVAARDRILGPGSGGGRGRESEGQGRSERRPEELEGGAFEGAKASLRRCLPSWPLFWRALTYLGFMME